jgi:putative transposase
MRELGLSGARRGKKKRTTIPDPQAARVGDLVNRKFKPTASNVLWVADFIYVSTWSGWVYVASVIDAYSRRIVGWRTATSMNTALVLDATEHAIWTAAERGHHRPHRTDSPQRPRVAVPLHRVHRTAIRHRNRRLDRGHGRQHDNALTETINGLYKTEL